MAALRRCLEVAVVLGADPRALRLEDWHGQACLVAPGHRRGPGARDARGRRPAARAGPARRPARGPRAGRAGDPAAGRPDAARGRAGRDRARAVGAPGAGGPRPAASTGCPSTPCRPTRRASWPCCASAAGAASRPSSWRRRRASRSPTTPARGGATPAWCSSGCCGWARSGPGYHTDISNFARGAAAHERHQALEVAEALLRAGLLGEKPSVGQRHIYLSVRALPEIHALIDRGETRRPAARRDVDRAGAYGCGRHGDRHHGHGAGLGHQLRRRRVAPRRVAHDHAHQQGDAHQQHGQRQGHLALGRAARARGGARGAARCSQVGVRGAARVQGEGRVHA